MKKHAIIITSFIVLLFSCGKEPHSPPTVLSSYDANRFVEQLNHDAYAFEYFHLVKPQTNEYGGWIVVDYYNKGKFSHSYALNVDWFEKSEYPSTLGYYEWWNDTGIEVEYNQNDGLYHGGGYKFEETKYSQKDLEKVGQKIEQVNLTKISSHLLSDYGLSENRSLKIAKVVQNWKKNSKLRNMTDRDAQVLFKKIVGFDFKKSVKALKAKYEGDSDELEKLFEESGNFNGTDPENIRFIFNKFF